MLSKTSGRFRKYGLQCVVFRRDVAPFSMLRSSPTLPLSVRLMSKKTVERPNKIRSRHERLNMRQESRKKSPAGKEKDAPKTSDVKAEGSPANPRFDLFSSDFQQRLIRSLIPAKYRATGYSYTWDHAYALGQRLPIAAALIFGLFVWEKTCFLTPFYPIRPMGESMLPTIACDTSEVWLMASPWVIYLWRWRRALFGDGVYKKGDILGYAAPDKPSMVLIKRVAGLSGETVASCGEYVKLFINQDPINLGRPWAAAKGHPLEEVIQKRYTEEMHQRQMAPQNGGKPFYLSTEVVPEGDLWVESDCPAMGVDSRQHGPIPKAWVCGVVVARLWPLRRLDRPKSRRPHPIPMDDETLKRYGLHRQKQQHHQQQQSSD